jgi:putative DNA primase/helicase
MTPFADFLDSPSGRFFKAQVAAALTRDFDRLAKTLLGRPKLVRRNEMRFPHGLVIRLDGRKRGVWKCWTAGIGGGPVQLIQFARGCDEVAAWEWAGHYVGVEPEARTWTKGERKEWIERQKRERMARLEQQRRAEEQDRAERIRIARSIWEASAAIGGTLGEKYLTETRGIPAPADGWPHDVVRYHAGDRAVVFAATTDDGEVQAVHSIYLTATAKNRHRANGSKIKITHGVLDGAVARLPGPVDKPLQIGEGGETSLSAWRATGYATWILLGALAGAKPPRGRIVIGLVDDDAPGSPADQALQKSLVGWRKDGINIQLATPWPVPRFDKSDFNDLLRETGDLDAVRQRIRLAELAAHGLAPAPAPFALPTATAATIRTAVSAAITDFFAHRSDTPSPRVLLSGATGIGKTQELGVRLPATIEVDKAKKRPHRVIIAVPAHKLGRQIVQRYRQLAADTKVTLDITVFEGRGNPWQPPPLDREYLCNDLAAVGLALEAGADVTATVCGSAKSETRCRFRDGCAYFAQIERAKAADIVIVAHNFLFDPLPQALLDNVGAVIIEEDFTTHGIGTVELPIATFDDKALWLYPVLEDGAADHHRTAQLDELYQKLRTALTSAADGQQLAEALAAAGLTSKSIGDARRLSWKRKLPDDMRPGMSLDERRTASLAAAKINPVVRRIHAVLSAVQRVAEQAENDDAAAPPISFDGGKITVHRLREPASWLKSLSVLIASASVRPDLVRRFFPTLEHKAPPMPALPHQTVRQYLGAFGKAGITRKKLDELVIQIRFEAAIGKTVLVITHMRDEHAFAGIPGVRTLHHGNVAGDDDFGDVDLVVQIGGPFAPQAEIARLASAESGRLVPSAKPVRRPCIGLLADGSGMRFERLAYEDPAAQAVHAGIYDESFTQGGLGRGRGVNRSINSPLDIRIFGNVPLPVPIHSIDRWRPANRIAKMLLRGAVHLNASDMHCFYRDLFPSPGAAAQAIHRWNGRTALITEVNRLARQLPAPWVEVTWQPNGQGHRTRKSYVASANLAAVHAEAVREFPAGLAAWTVAPFTAGAAAPPSLWVAEDADIAGKKGFFPDMSASSSATSQFSAGLGAGAPPEGARAPPDG